MGINRKMSTSGSCLTCLHGQIKGVEEKVGTSAYFIPERRVEERKQMKITL
jgi:hypothetical protein